MGKEPLTGAMWLLRMTVAIPLGAVVGGRLLAVIGIRPVVIMGLGMSALGLFLVSTWDLNVVEPWLTLHLLIAGLGFGLNNTPIMTRALDSVSDDYRGTAASLVVVARMLGMTLGLAALSAWGVEHFQVLTAGLELPLPEAGDAAGALQARLVEYNNRLSAAGLSLFHNFFRVAGGVALVAILPALAMGGGKTQGEGA
jgi:MFS family permease